MRIKLAILFALILAFAGLPASAQKSKSVLTSEILTQFPDQFSGAITPAKLRQVTTDMVNSWQQYSGVNPQTVSPYAFLATDYGQLVTFNNAGTFAVTLPQPIGTFSTFNVYASDVGSGSVVITPTLSTINGASSYTLTPGQSVWIVSDGTNYQIFAGGTGSGGTGLIVGSTTISGCGAGYVLYNNGNKLGCEVITGTGTVVNVSGATPGTNGFTVTTTNPTTTPVVTVATSITGFLQGNGTAITAATTTGTGSTLVLATGPTINNPALTGSILIGGNAMAFPTVPATLDYLIGSASSGHCVQFSGTAGGIADAGAACGSGGGGGGSTANRQDFVAPGGFSPGTTSSLVLSSAPVTANAVTVTFDGVTQAGNTWSLSGSTINFDAAIPASVAVVDVSWLSASVSLGTVQSVGLNEASTTPIFSITNSPVTNAGTLTETLKPQTANTVFAGPTTGLAAQPSFRHLVGADLPLATSSLVGGVQGDGSTLTISTGVISCTTATSSQIGCVKPDGTIITDIAGAITVPKATSAVFGVVEVDGTTITASGGVISSTAGVVWPTSKDIVVSNGTSTPAGLAEVDGDCVVGAAGAWTAGSCLGGAAVSSVTGTSGEITASPTTGNVVLTLPSTISSPATLMFSNTINMTGTFEIGSNAFSIATGAVTLTANSGAGSSVTLPASGTLVNTAVTSLSSLATVGTIATGTWHGTVIGAAYGGTGENNGSNTLTLGGALTTTGAATPTLAFGSGSYTYTFGASANDTVALLGKRAQALVGGVEITSYSIGTVTSGTTTIDCGNSPQQYLTNGGAFTFHSPAADGNCLVMITNNGSAGAVTFTGFTSEASHGDALDTTSGHAFTISVWEINSVADYRVVAMQ
jgi:hypothetical protein